MAFPLIKQLLENNGVAKKKVATPNLRIINDKPVDSLVMDQEEIENILYKMQKNHALLTVEMNDGKILSSSMILEINIREQYLVIDEFFPKRLNKQIDINDNIEISCNHTGSSLRFMSQILAIAEKDNAPYYKIPFPDIVEYSQRRQSHRVPISMATPSKITFTTENNSVIHGILKDISYGGFCARLTPPISERFKPGSHIPKCILQLPSAGVIVCTSEVRRMFVSNGSGIPMMGCQFGDMNGPDRKSLQQTIVKLERELMKQIKR